MLVFGLLTSRVMSFSKCWRRTDTKSGLSSSPTESNKDTMTNRLTTKIHHHIGRKDNTTAIWLHMHIDRVALHKFKNSSTIYWGAADVFVGC